MRWRLLASLLLVLPQVPETLQGGSNLSVQVAAQRGSAYLKVIASREDSDRVTRVVLRNGLTLLIEEYPLAPLATVMTHVRMGYAQEGPQNQGLTHLLRNLYLRRSQVIRQMRALGAEVEIRVDYQGTSIVSTGPAENLLKMLNLHADLIRDPKIDAKAVEQEVEILRRERLRKLGSPRLQVTELLLEWLYPQERPRTGFSWREKDSPLLGDRDLLIQRLAEFHKSYFHPQNLLLVISGKVRRERILPRVAEWYGSFQSPSEGVLVKQQEGGEGGPSEASFRYRHVRGEVERPLLFFAYPVPGLGHSDYHPLLVLSYLLGRGRGGLLEEALAETASGVETELRAFPDRGTFLVAVEANPQKVDGAEVAVLAQLELLRRQGVTASQLDRAKALLVVDYYQRLERLQERTYLLAVHESRGSYTGRDRLPERLAEVTPERINQLLERYFQDSNLALMEYFPREAEPRTFTPPALLETLRLLVSAVLREGETDESERWRPADLQSTFEPPKFTPTFLQSDLKQTSILRGPVIYYKEEKALPLVHLGFFFPGGRARESTDNAGITELLLRAVLRNVASLEGSPNWFEMERMGAELRVVNEPDFFGFQTAVLSPHLSSVFGTLIKWFRNLAVVEQDLESARQEVVRLINRLEEEEDFFALLQAVRERLFPDDPYGLPRYGTPETLSRISLESLQQWLKQEIQGVHPYILIRGNVQGTGFLRQFVSLMSDSKYEVRPPQVRGLSSQPSQVVFQEEEGQVLLGFAGPALGSRELAALEVLSNFWSGPGGILSEELRNRGLAYDFTLLHQAGLRGGAIFARCLTFGDQEEKARQELIRELAELRLSETQFLNAVVEGITQFHIARQAGRDYITQVAGSLLSGRGTEEARKYLSTLGSLRKEEVESISRKYLSSTQKTDSLPESP